MTISSISHGEHFDVSPEGRQVVGTTFEKFRTSAIFIDRYTVVGFIYFFYTTQLLQKNIIVYIY